MANVKYSPNAELRIIKSLLMLGDFKSIHARKAMLQLDEDCFYNRYLRDFFSLIKHQYDNSKPFDEYTLLDLIRTLSEAHHQAMDKIVFKEPASLANLEAYIDEVVIAKQLRQQIKAASLMLDNCKNTNNNHESAQALQDGLKEITAISLNKSKDGRTLEEIGERYFAGEYEQEKIPTNISFIDDANKGGIQNNCLITICGDTGVGKTYFALYLMQKIGNCSPDKHSLYFNLEMSEQYNWMRSVGIKYGKPFDSMTDDEKRIAHGEIIKHKVTIYEEKYSDIDEIITLARVKALEKPLSVIVVDYITLVTCKSDYHRNDLEQVSIAKRLASLAIELKCIVIATSQTNRNPQNRSKDDRCPYMSDAADSSGNYKSAEIWIGIDRPELYNDNPVFTNKFIAKVRKNRNGLLFNAVWDFNVGTFAEINQRKFFHDMEMQAGSNEKPKPNIFTTDREYINK